MEVVESVAACRAVLDQARAAGRVVGLVPTMGALHDGHTSLLNRARAECDVVAVSIFVNPLQFGDPEDIAHYPRTLERDLVVCAEAGADVVFVPSVPEMYPSWPDAPSTTVSVRGVSEAWEGASRPGHFDGVATVVAKLFTIAGPCRAYFGLKDFQQLAVVRRMARELSLPVEVVGCPIVREPDGLALSSRNVRLSPAERQAATVLSRALAAGRAALAGGERSGAAVAAGPCAPWWPPSRWWRSTTPCWSRPTRSTRSDRRRRRGPTPCVAAPADRRPGGPRAADRQQRRAPRRPTMSAPYPAPPRQVRQLERIG